MKNLKFLALCAIGASLVVSCQKEELANEIQPESLEISISKAHQDALIEAAVNPGGAVYSTQEYLDGTRVEGITSGDIFFPLNKLEQGLYELANTVDGESKQYRVNNLISSRNRTIDILGYTGRGNALSGNMRTGLEWAVNNYNRINTTLNFRLTFGTNYQAADMVVYNNNQSGAGGQAEFPSGGRPGKFIQILRDTGRSSSNINEHVIGHEMGHAVGFRHTDYARRKCDRSNEGPSQFGAVNIPGTPTANQWGQSGLDTNSLMISCFDGSEDGEFSSTDIVALEFMY